MLFNLHSIIVDFDIDVKLEISNLKANVMISKFILFLLILGWMC